MSNPLVKILRTVATVATTDGALSMGKHNPVDATSGTRTMTLPTPGTSTAGRELYVAKVDSTLNTVVVSGNIDGVASTTVTLYWRKESLKLLSDGTTWWVIGGHKRKTDLDAAYGPVITFERYGAVGDGTTDDTVACQAALDALKATPGGRLKVGAKTYAVTGLTLDYSTVTAQASSGAPYGMTGPVIYGSGRASKLKQLTTATVGQDLLTINGFLNAAAGPGSNNKLTGLVVERLEFLGNYTGGPTGDPSTTPGGRGLVIRSVMHVRLADLWATRMPGHGIDVLRQYFGAAGDEYVYGVIVDHCKATVNGGWGFRLGNPAGAAISFTAPWLDATSNRLGGITAVAVNSQLLGGIAVGNGGPGYQQLNTNQAPGTGQNISTSGSNHIANFRGEQNLGPDFDIQAGSGTVLDTPTCFSTSGEPSIALGCGQSGVTLNRVTIVGGLLGGDGTSSGQPAITLQPTSTLAATVASGATSITTKYQLQVASGDTIQLKSYSGGVPTTITTTATAAVTIDPTRSGGSTIPVAALSASVAAGAAVIDSSAASDLSGGTGQIINTRVNFTTYGGSRSSNASLLIGANLSWLDPATHLFNPNGALEYRTALTYSASDSITGVSGRVQTYPKLSSSNFLRLIAKLPTGAEVVLASEPETGMATVPILIAGTATPTTGTWKVGDRCLNTTTATDGSGIVEWRCTVAGTPGTWVAIYGSLNPITSGGTATVLATSDPTVTSDTSNGYSRGQHWVNTTTSVLFIAVSVTTGAAVWVRQVADVQTFTTSGTWTKPAWAKTARGYCIGGGGGGGAGALTASGTASSGGAGGGGGGYSTREIAMSQLGATETVTIGAAGTGGAAQATASTVGASGTAGGNSSFGTHIRALGGGLGQGGQTAASSTSGTAGSGASLGGAGGTGANGAAGNAGVLAGGAPGGGAGGGVSTAPAAFAGGAGAGSSSASYAAGTAGTTGGGTGGNGTAATTSEPSPGGSGGGGGSATGATNGGAGGAGGLYGAGGGGGGSAINGATSGAGGAGAGGIVVVVSL